MSDIVSVTRRYETWLARQVPTVPGDLRLKHQRMVADVFAFLRATCYAWAGRYPVLCPELAGAPHVLAVGDLHVENFGTWRDAEGRLVWGVNDFDETAELPYAQDLVRLATSALAASRESHLAIGARRACDSLLAGYRASIETGGEPVVLGERHRWLRELAANRLQGQRRFWQRLEELPVLHRVPARPRQLLRAAMPAGAQALRFVHRQAGMGSLGRQRVLALARWQGGRIGREAKPLAPSAYLWAAGSATQPPRCAELLGSALRVPDPFLSSERGWLVRRLASDCSRVELSALPRQRDEAKLLWMMGWETANVHLGSRGARTHIRGDLSRRGERWLLGAAKRMLAATLEDHAAWVAAWRRRQ